VSCTPKTQQVVSEQVLLQQIDILRDPEDEYPQGMREGQSIIRPPYFKRPALWMVEEQNGELHLSKRL